MRYKALSLIAFVAAAVLMLSSCQAVTISTAEQLLTPPIYYPEYEGLVKAFNEQQGSNVSLCTPLDGDYKSAITVTDLNDDGIEDAVIFYKKTAENDSVRLCIMKQGDKGWEQTGAFMGYGTKVSSMGIEDLNDDGILEIIVTWSLSTANTASAFTLYSASDNSIKYTQLHNESCEMSQVIDLDGDKAKEILLICQTNSGDVLTKTAKLIKCTDKSAKVLGTAFVDSNISGYSVINEYNNDTVNGIYIDCYKGDTQMVTELIYWDEQSKTLVAPFTDSKTHSNTVTQRYEQICSGDINNDGILDIPVQTQEPDAEKEKITESVVTYWTDFDSTGEGTVIMDTYVNTQDNYYIDLSKLLHNSVGMRSYQNFSSRVVYLDSDEENENGNELFSIIKISSERYESESFNQYIKLFQDEDGIVLGYIASAGKKYGYDDIIIKTAVTQLP